MQTTVEAVKVLLKDPSTGTYLIPYLAEAAKVDKNGNEITGTYATKEELANYLSLAGGTVTGALSVGGGITASLNGNASSATKATQDSAGQQINTTYIKNVSVNGRTITFTRGNGTTFTITTQDTVTTNTSNWSVSNGTNGWEHVITPRDLQLRGWWLMQTPEAALVSQEVFLPLDLSKGQLFQTLVVHPKTMKTVLATIQIHP